MIKRYWVYSQVQVNNAPVDDENSQPISVFNNGMGIELPVEISEFKHIDGIVETIKQTLAAKMQLDHRRLIVNVLSFSPFGESFQEKFLRAGR